jgi:hypothetical protein
MFYKDDKRASCAYCADRHVACPLFHDVATRTTDDVFEMLFVRSGKDIVIDNSKRSWWAEQHEDAQGFAKKYIHIVRDPRGVLFSRKQRGRTTKLSHWPKQNRRFHNALVTAGADYRMVVYNELAEDREATLRGLTAWLGIAYEPAMRDYWLVPHHGAGRNGASAAFASDAGHADSAFYAARARVAFHDLRWRDEMEPGLRAAVEGDAATLAVLETLGLAFSEDGLRRVAPPVVLSRHGRDNGSK